MASFAGGLGQGLGQGFAIGSQFMQAREQRAAQAEAIKQKQQQVARDLAGGRLKLLQAEMTNLGNQVQMQRAEAKKAGREFTMPEGMHTLFDNAKGQIARDLAISNPSLDQQSVMGIADLMARNSIEGGPAETFAAADRAGKIAGAQAGARREAAPQISFQSLTDADGNRIIAGVSETGELKFRKSLGKVQNNEFQLGRFKANLALRAQGRDVDDGEVQGLSPDEAEQTLSLMRGPDFLGSLLRATGQNGGAPSAPSQPAEEESGTGFKNLIEGFFGADAPSSSSAVTIPIGEFKDSDVALTEGGALSEEEFALLLKSLASGQSITPEIIERLSNEQLQRLRDAQGG